jgi:tetratricopeptide (TPR) repeat protein
MDWLQGKQVAFTGTFASVTKRDAVQLVRNCHAEYAAKVGPKTDFLIVGQRSWPLQMDGTLTKRLQKAQRLQQEGCAIAILAEEELLARLGLQTDGIRRRYTLSQLIQLLGIPRPRMRAWMRAGLIEPVESQHGVSYFDFRQVVGARTLCELANAGISAERIRRSLEQLRHWLGDVEQPLHQLALLERNGQLLVRLEEGLVEPSGQMCFDFGDEPAIFRASPASAAQCFESGCYYEEEGALEEAADAYRQALLLGGPTADACFNLANVLFALDQKQEACERYRQVVEIDPRHAESWNNLGITLNGLGRVNDAVEAFQKSISLQYGDAHYNLADLLDSLGRRSEARCHWQSYLRHQPYGRWSDYARRKLG